MTRRYFKDPFAVLGDKSVIPETVQSDGSISYQEGYGPDYSLDPLLDSNAKDVPRLGENELFYVVTQALQQLQQDGTPDFITNADNFGTDFEYTFNQLALYSGQAYRSLIDDNTDLPNAGLGSWQVDNFYVNGVAGGSANALTLWPTQTYQSFQFGDTVQFIASATNTDVCTLQVGAGAPIDLMKATSLGVVDLDPNDISIGLNTAIFDGTEWILLTTSSGAGSLVDYAQVSFAHTSSQSISSGTTASGVKLNFDNVIYDPNSWWDNTNKWFLPTIPGVYRVNLAVHGFWSGNSSFLSMLTLNGTLLRRIGEDSSTASGIVVNGGSCLVQMNGVSDNISAASGSVAGATAGYDGGDGFGDTTCLFEIEYVGAEPSLLLEKVKRANEKRKLAMERQVSVNPLIAALDAKKQRELERIKAILKEHKPALDDRRERLEKQRIQRKQRMLPKRGKPHVK